MKKFLLFGLVAVFALSLAGCNNKPEEKDDDNQPQQEERTLVVASAELTGDFYTGWGTSSYDVDVRDLVWGYGLMTSNPAGEVIDSPLVEEKVVSEDLLTWTFKIKEGITFHNGEEFGVDDVAYTYEFYMNDTALADADGGSSTLSSYVESVTADTAARTVTFTLKKVVYTTDVSVFFTYILPKDTIEAGLAADSEVTTAQAWVRKNISEPVGYGAYKLVEYSEPEYATFEIFEDYIGNWQGNQPAIEKVIIQYVPNETEMDQLLSGAVDMLTRTVEDEKITAAKNALNLTTNNYYRHGGGTMVLHTDFEEFQLTEVRQAFAYIFNRPKVIELFLGQYGIASNGPYSKNHWMMYDDDEQHLVGTDAVSRFEATLTNYDILDADGNFDEAANIAKANELLDAAAAKTDGAYADLTGNSTDGFLWKGEPLTIKVAFTAFWNDTYNLVFPQNYISQLPFDVDLVSLTWPTMYGHWIGDIDEARKYHAFVGGMGYALKENPKASYHTDEIMPWGEPSSNGARFSGGSTYTAEEWNQLLVDIENANPVTGRDEYRTNWREFVRTFNQELPIIPVYSNNYHDLYNSDVENFNTNALWAWTAAVVDANWYAE